MSEVNKRIRELREKQNMSLNQFSHGVRELSKSYLSMIENGERPVTEELLKKIAKKHCVHEDWLRDGTGEVYDRERAGFKELYMSILEIVRRYPKVCANLRKHLLPDEFETLDPKGRCLSVLDRFPELTLQHFYDSEAEPRALVEALCREYHSIELSLDSFVKMIALLKDPEQGLFEFYLDDKAWIDRIEAEVLECRAIFVNNRGVMERNMDNNDLLNMSEYYELYHRGLTYKENIEMLKLLREKTKKPGGGTHF